MSDIKDPILTILHGADGSDWVQFLKGKFMADKLKLHIQDLNLSDLDYENSSELSDAVRDSHVIILLLTQNLIELMESEGETLSKVINCRSPTITSVVVATLYIQHDDALQVFEEAKYKDQDWVMVEIDQDPKKVENLIKQTLQRVEDSINKRAYQEKKSKFRKGFAESDTPITVQIFPKHLQEPGEKTLLVFDEAVTGNVGVTLIAPKHREELKTEQMNPYCFSFAAPNLPVGTDFVKLKIASEHDKQEQEQKEVKTNRLSLHRRHSYTSVELMCDTMRISKEDLDKELKNSAEKSLISDRIGCTWLDSNIFESEWSSTSSSTYPTLLHWAAGNGLQELTSCLLTFPMSSRACQLENCDKDVPSSLAHKNGYSDLSRYIDDFMEAQDVYETYCRYVQFAPKAEPQGNYEEMELIPRTEEAQGIYIDPCPEPATPPRKEQQDATYELPVVPPKPSKTLKPQQKSQVMSHKDFLQVHHRMKEFPGGMGLKHQNELIEIQKMFTEGEISLAQTEMCFESWKQKYGSLNMKSFKDKIAMLEEFKVTHKETIDLLSKARDKDMQVEKRKVKDRKHSATVEEETLADKVLPISDPFHTRSGRGRGGISRHANTSTASTSSSSSCSSNDSGWGSVHRISGESVEGKRSSIVQQYLELKETDVTDSSIPPPLPARPADKKIPRKIPPKLPEKPKTKPRLPLNSTSK